MAGYTVIEAMDGAHAVEKFRPMGPDSIQLLVLDVVMPVKNGKEAYHEIKAVKRDVKVLFMSGYTNDVVLEKGILKGAVDYVSKPPHARQLLYKVSGRCLNADKTTIPGAKGEQRGKLRKKNWKKTKENLYNRESRNCPKRLESRMPT